MLRETWWGSTSGPSSVGTRTAGSIVAVLLAASPIGCARSESSDDGVRPVVVDDVAGGVVTTTLVFDGTPAGSAPDPADPLVAADVEAAYLAAISAIDSASLAGDPDHPGLAGTMTGEAIAATQARIRQRLFLRQSVGFPSDSIQRVEILASQIVDAKTADVRVCIVDDGVVVDTASGMVIDDSVGISVLTERLILVDGSWKLGSRSLESRGESNECSLDR